MADDEAIERGREIRARAQGAQHEGLRARLEAIDPQLSEFADSFIFGGVWARPGLEFQERMLVAITALAVGGNLTQLRNYLHAALQDGVEPAKVHEALLMTCVYSGFPTAIGALDCWKGVLESHERNPATDG